ncbi:hypothetical protein [Microbacterium immunditiarum]|uniref:Uncharacterized protein n=1 Tax=Microbacterium immunditiarum TaxID=337480 RepID=A0A7Y9KJB0_9MICO|nr:hypothetical protein [Microbacterium immunditiarum]NYE19461.1 hypothetical protein [Microbacterium immunditiarum]
MTPDAQERNRASQIEATRATLISSTSHAVDEIDKVAAAAAERADELRPRVDTTDPAHLARTAQAWEYNIAPMLAAGRHWMDILRITSEDDLLAIERFAPNWIRANRPPLESEAEITALRVEVANRYATAATDPAVRAAMQAVRDTNTVLDVTRQIAARAANARSASDVASIEVTAILHAHELGVSPSEEHDV